MCGSPAAILLGMIATRTESMADLFEKLQGELETLSASVFRANDRTVRSIFNALRQGSRTSTARRGWPAGEPARLCQPAEDPRDGRRTPRTLNEIMLDIDSIVGYASFLIDRTKFLMDAAIGSSNISQARRLNIFTVLSVIMMPPTLIASIYGMNFEHMPELDWLLGYPMAAGPDGGSGHRTDFVLAEEGNAVRARMTGGRMKDEEIRALPFILPPSSFILASGNHGTPCASDPAAPAGGLRCRRCGIPRTASRWRTRSPAGRRAGRAASGSRPSGTRQRASRA